MRSELEYPSRLRNTVCLYKALRVLYISTISHLHSSDIPLSDVSFLGKSLDYLSKSIKHQLRSLHFKSKVKGEILSLIQLDSDDILSGLLFDRTNIFERTEDGLPF